MSAKTYLKIAMGKLDSRVAFMLGKVKVKGDKQSLVSVRECFNVAKVK
jgi:putative sterol carrier protein